MSPNQYYKTDEEYMFAGAEALRTEYKTITDAGLFVQIDDAHLPFTYDRMVPPASPNEFRSGPHPRRRAESRAARHPRGPRPLSHLLGQLERSALERRAAQRNRGPDPEGARGRYSIEAANPRHEHEWQVWKDVKLPEDKKLIPGVVSHQTNVVEHPELVAERLLHFANVVGRDHVMAGTDCGFAQGPFVRRVHPSIQWAKLQSLAAGAKLASKALWKTGGQEKEARREKKMNDARMLRRNLLVGSGGRLSARSCRRARRTLPRCHRKKQPI